MYELLKGVVTRIPIYDKNGAAIYVIHQSLLFKYITKMSIESPSKAVDIASLTLDDFLAFENMNEIVGKSLAFVPESANLREAKSKMEETPNCQDVFVTATGDPREPVRGWLTNIDISKHAKA